MTRITETPDMAIVLSDGCRLSARVWMPDNAADIPVPAILEYLPYRKRDGTVARDALTHPWFAARGYACLRVDMRGNGDSEGLMADEYTAQELADAVEVINWIAAQDWCSGTVGMMGISWGGFNALQVAALAPDPLKAIITLCSTDDRYADDIHYKGGCLLNENLGWGATMLSYSSRPPDPEIVSPRWRQMWLERLEHEPFLPAVWLQHQHRDAYWQHGSVCEDFSAINAATLAVGGWGDAYSNAVPRLLAGLDAPAKGITGPWVHKYPHFAVPEPRIGFLQEALHWWDRWLKHEPNGAEDLPAWRGHVMDSVAPKRWYTERQGRWIAEAEWPAPAIADRRLHLHPDGTLAGTKASRDLTQRVASPLDCGMGGGEYCAIWLGPEMPGDQRGDDALSVCFDAAGTAEAIDIVGAPVLHLTLAADRPVAQIAVRLCDVAPDGASTRITYGVLNLCHRSSHAEPEPLSPGQPFDIRLQLDDIAWNLPRGHRLRVAISSSYWPLIWPVPEQAGLDLVSGYLDLPVRPVTSGDEVSFAEPDAAPPWQAEELRAPRHVRRIEHDLQGETVALVIEDDFGASRDSEHGLITGAVARERWTIRPDDPLSALGQTHWTQTLARDGWSIRTETFADMWSDATTFHLRGRIEAYESGRKVFERDFKEAVPRNLL
ncbi:MAG: CocE/NonD family hydrolase [Minwuia sp.]|nr:CocE/NonD family hydrolase [Minwuia sp.]